jgi:hypothetical protein
MSRVGKRGIIFEQKHSPESAYVLLSGVARITCRNRKGRSYACDHGRAGNDSGRFPMVSGIKYDFRCEAVTDCQIGTVSLVTFIEIARESPRRISSAWLPAILDDGIWCNCAARISWAVPSKNKWR